MHKMRVAPTLAFAVALTVLPASAATIAQFSSLTEWSNAVSGAVILNYEEAVLGAADKDYSTDTGYSKNGIEVTGYVSTSTYWLHGVVGSPTTAWWWDFGTGGILRAYDNFDGKSKIVITYKNAPTAIGLYLGSNNNVGMPVSVLVNQGDRYTVATASTRTMTWWGITSDVPITTAEFSVPSGPDGPILVMDYMSAGIAQEAVPEASTMLLCAGGLVGVGLWRKRRQR